jgi:hypothetical protein
MEVFLVLFEHCFRGRSPSHRSFISHCLLKKKKLSSCRKSYIWNLIKKKKQGELSMPLVGAAVVCLVLASVKRKEYHEISTCFSRRPHPLFSFMEFGSFLHPGKF